MRPVPIIFLGGGLGACARAATLEALAPTGSPWPVLLINLIGAFALGIVYVLADEAGLLDSQIRFFLAVGVLGGFTTFSTFGWGADLQFAHGSGGTAIAYLAASVAGGLFAVGCGLVSGREAVAVLERKGIVHPVRTGPRSPRRTQTRTIDVIEAEDRNTPPD